MFRSTILQSARLARTPLTRSVPPRSLLRPLSTTPRFLAQQTTAEGLPYPVKGKQEKPNPHADPQHLTGTAAQEAKAIVSDFAELIAGRSPKAAAAGAREMPHAQGSIEADFINTTKSFAADIPQPALYFGLAGTLPYLGTSVTTVALAREASLAASDIPNISGLNFEAAMSALHTVEAVQITYGAIILSFLGALHWGMEFAKYGGQVGYQRLAIGVVPVFIGWPTTFLPHGIALATQWAGFTGMWMLDQRASIRGWTPPWYSTYRFYLSIIVGFSIIGTLAGTGYYGVGSGSLVGPGEKDVTTATLTSMKRLDQVAAKNHKSVSGVKKGHVGGDVETEDMGEEGDAFVKFVNKAKSAEEAEEEEKEHEEKAYEQDTKEIDQAATSPHGFKTEIKGRSNVRDGLEDKDNSAKPASETGKVAE
ncbi:hypothetical protein NCC49_002856 [Naganishia albida]|nr:hypothetical protein NCC49_002856 [Naganishia albida]